MRLNEPLQHGHETAVQELSESLMNELVGAVGLPKTDLTRSIMRFLAGKPATFLARFGVTFDRIVVEQGLPAACEWGLSFFCNPAELRIEDEIPQKGPLLIAATHPGAYDVLLYTATIKRKDIRWIATEIPFLQLLPKVSNHIFYVDRVDLSSRARALRDIVEHLKSGGAMIYLISGHRDPDPANFAGAESGMDNLLPVYDLFFNKVPDLKVQPALASGIVTKRWSNHLITKIRRDQIDRQRLAEFGQVITQLLNPGKLLVTTAVSFGKAVSRDELLQMNPGLTTHEAMVQMCKELLRNHARHFGFQLR